MNTLIRYLRKRAQEIEPIKPSLPIFHCCTFEEASEYVNSRGIKVENCNVFEEELVYLFLGKSRFRKEYTNNRTKHTPICFVLKPNSEIQIKRIFPFDTGAVVTDRYQPVFTKDDIEKVKLRFSLDNELPLAYVLITLFFNNLKNYVKEVKINLTLEEVEKISISGNVPEMEDIYGVYTCDWLKSDNRKLTIEIQSNSVVMLNNSNLAGVLLPFKFRVNSEFNKLYNDTGAKPIFYDPTMELLKESYYIEIIKKSIEITLDNVA